MEYTPHDCECGCGLQTRLDPSGKPRRFCQGHNSKRGPGTGWFDQGYKFISVNGERIAEHRHVVQQALKRPLESSEIVHHIDGDKTNNEPWNLMVMTRADHGRLHFTGKKVRRWTDEERQLAYDFRERGIRIDHIADTIGRPYSSTRDQIAKWRKRPSPAEQPPEEHDGDRLDEAA
jgi:hypothetical protein